MSKLRIMQWNVNGILHKNTADQINVLLNKYNIDILFYKNGQLKNNLQMTILRFNMFNPKIELNFQFHNFKIINFMVIVLMLEYYIKIITILILIHMMN